MRHLPFVFNIADADERTLPARSASADRPQRERPQLADNLINRRNNRINNRSEQS